MTPTPMQAELAAVTVSCHDTVRVFAAQIRTRAKAAAKVAGEALDERSPRLQTLIVLQQLHPGEAETAKRCHRILTAAAREDLDRYGYILWPADLLRLLFNYLDGSGWAYQQGRWVARERAAAGAGVTPGRPLAGPRGNC